MNRTEETEESEDKIEHLQCDSCTSNVTVARRGSEAKLVCHCTHDDAALDPVPVNEMAVIPEPWRWL